MILRMKVGRTLDKKNSKENSLKMPNLMTMMLLKRMMPPIKRLKEKSPKGKTRREKVIKNDLYAKFFLYLFIYK